MTLVDADCLVGELLLLPTGELGVEYTPGVFHSIDASAFPSSEWRSWFPMAEDVWWLDGLLDDEFFLLGVREFGFDEYNPGVLHS